MEGPSGVRDASRPTQLSGKVQILYKRLEKGTFRFPETSEAEATRTLYSLVGSCKRHQIDPFAYLKDILERLPTQPADRLGELLPDAWVAANPDARRRAVS